MARIIIDHLPCEPAHLRRAAHPIGDRDLDSDSDVADAAWLYAWARDALCPSNETPPAILIVPV
jgi:hypothetical protein